jgi:hypothetical protein
MADEESDQGKSEYELAEEQSSTHFDCNNCQGENCPNCS